MSKSDTDFFRYLLWLHHGCPISNLYGDDGEMQCNNTGCLIDFKRMSPRDIHDRFMARNRIDMKAIRKAASVK